MDSSNTSSRATYIAVSALVATSVLAYAVYFDYKRRNDADFRRKLKKEKKRVDKAAAQAQAEEEAPLTVSPEMLREALEAIKNEPVPSLEQREGYFMSQVSMGEQLASQGPTFHLPAAIAFFRALRVYPAPAELIGIYESTVPAPVFKLVVQMTNLDVTARVQGYLEVFPPKSLNVRIQHQDPGIRKGAHHVLVVTKDFKAGDTIYTEHPIVAVLDQDLQTAGTHCTNCFRLISPDTRVHADEAPAFPSYFCSNQCLLASLTTSTGLLFTDASPLPDALLAGPMPELGKAERREAQAKFAEYIKEEKRNNPLLAARFIARQVVNETAKLAAVAGSPSPSGLSGTGYAEAEEGDYTLADHIERWRYIEATPPDQELPLLSTLLKATLPGLEAFTTENQYATLVGKMAYNAIGVTFNGGRDDKPAPAIRPEDVEKSRTPHGTHRQIGSAIYNVSSYLSHSCSPSTTLTFPNNTTELALIATKDLKAGDVLTVAYVDVEKKDGETKAECKRRRRVELVRGWKFACPCERCEAEADEVAAELAAAAATAAVAANPGPVIVDEAVFPAASAPAVVEEAVVEEAAAVNSASEAEFPPLPTLETKESTPTATTVTEKVPVTLPEAEETTPTFAEIAATPASDSEIIVETPSSIESDSAFETPLETPLTDSVNMEDSYIEVEAEPVGEMDESKIDDAVTRLEANPPAPLPARGEVE